MCLMSVHYIILRYYTKVINFSFWTFRLCFCRARDNVEINVKDYKKCQECDEILSADGSTWVAVVSRKMNESILATAAEFRSKYLFTNRPIKP